ncbi:MAG: YqzL family protein [Firmicutes bacterium]|nr:YqzL family protein [Bacillota bacterium]HQD40668.1 YqzL family protein [Bacillota bacterium]
MLTADFFWKLFEVTGSITAYILYRQLSTLDSIPNIG